MLDYVIFKSFLLLIREPRNLTFTFVKFSLVEDIGMCEHALFQRNYKELRLWEVGLNHLADILGVRQVQSGVYLIKDVDWGWLYLQEGENE